MVLVNSDYENTVYFLVDSPDIMVLVNSDYKNMVYCLVDSPDIMVLVNSDYRNIEKRNAVRSTWGQYVQEGKWLKGKNLGRWKIKVAFLFGESIYFGEWEFLFIFLFYSSILHLLNTFLDQNKSRELRFNNICSHLLCITVQ